MKRLLPLLFVFCCTAAFAQNPSDTLVLTSSFPDSAFRAQLLVKIDQNKDKKLQWGEVLGTTKLSLVDSKIKSLVGIELFANLDSLGIRSLSITSLDLTKNEKMKMLTGYWQSSLKVVTVSKKAPYSVIGLGGNNLDSFDASGLKQLKTLSVGAQKLTFLNIQGTTLDYLNAFENPKVMVCVDSKAQWDAIRSNDLRICFEQYGPQNWCNYELTCILSTDLNEPTDVEPTHLPYKDYDLVGQELLIPAQNRLVIRRYANGKSEKRLVRE